MKKKILVIGSLNMDMCIRVAQIPKAGETILARDLNHIPGGKGANQAGAAGRSEGDVVMLGCVGNDEFGRIQSGKLQSMGVDTSGLKISEDSPTGIAVIYVDDDGNNNIAVVPGANFDCDTSYLKEQDEQFQKCDYVLLQMEIPEESICYAVQRAKELGKTVILNPAPAPDSLPEAILKCVDYLTPNETEVSKLAGCGDCSLESVKEGAQRLLNQGIGNVIVTLGDKGSLLVNKEQQTIYPTRKVTAVDTTAAGDCFNGAFVTALSEGRSVEEAILFASTAASIAVTRKGALKSVPKREETDLILKEWKGDISLWQ